MCSTRPRPQAGIFLRRRGNSRSDSMNTQGNFKPALALDAPAIARSVKRIAHEIVERNDGAANIVLVGIVRRGATLAERLAEAMNEGGMRATCRSARSTSPPIATTGRARRATRACSDAISRLRSIGNRVVLVDDVLYTGRTVRAALDALADLGRPESIQLAVMVDRGERELPIRADYVGRIFERAARPAGLRAPSEVDGIDEVVIGGANRNGGLSAMARLGKNDIVSIEDLDLVDIERIFELADWFRRRARTWRTLDVAHGLIMATLFYEPSTRTRLSFESAMHRLGGAVISSADMHASSAAKGETLADTVRVVSAYADVIVMRHPHDGAARVAAEYAPCPVINAGDGSREHPTQTLCDLYILRRKKGHLRGLTVAHLRRFEIRPHRPFADLCAGPLRREHPGRADNGMNVPDYVLERVAAESKYRSFDGLDGRVAARSQAESTRST